MESRISDGERCAIIRLLILDAPPCELRAVLKNLRVITGDDELFFDVIPSFCLEYHLRNQSVLPIEVPVPQHRSVVRFTNTVETGAAVTPVSGVDPLGGFLLVARVTHLGSCLRRFAKRRLEKRTSLAHQLASYFSTQRSYPLTEVERSSGGAERGLRHLDFVFFDLERRCYVEIDPVESRCVRAVSFSIHGDVGTGTALPCFLKEIEDMSTGVHYGRPGRVLQTLRRELQLLTASHYGVRTAERGHLPEVKYADEALRQRHNEEVRAAFSATFTLVPSLSSVFADADGDKHAGSGALSCKYTINLASERTFLRNMWTGRWKSIFVIEEAVLGDAPGSASSSSCGDREGPTRYVIRGETNVVAHYFENGNMHMQVARVMPPTALPVNWPRAPHEGAIDPTLLHTAADGPDDWELAQIAIRWIRSHEQCVQEELLQCCSSVGSAAVQGLRRRLPITKELFDFKKAVMGVGLPRPLYMRADRVDSGDDSAKSQ